jgi:hypothetical protein
LLASSSVPDQKPSVARLIARRIFENSSAWFTIAGYALKINDTVEQPLYRLSRKAPKPLATAGAVVGAGRMFALVGPGDRGSDSRMRR